MKPDQERVKSLLADTVTLLCRNGLHFQRQLRVQGVLGITVDDSDVFIVHINESYAEQGHGVRLADFPGPLGASFAASLVASLSSAAVQPAAMVGACAPKSETGIVMQTNINPQHSQSLARQQKHKQDDISPSGGQKRARADAGQYVPAQDVKCLAAKDAASAQQVALAGALTPAQWTLDVSQKQQQQVDRMRIAEAPACYLGYAAAGLRWPISSASTSTSSVGASANKRKANVYPPQSMLMSFGGVDYTAGVLQAAAAQPQSSADGCSVNTIQSSVQSGSKLWNDPGEQQLVTDDQRLTAAVFDQLGGCSAWAVPHLIDGQVLQVRDDDQQQQSNLDVIHELNPLGLLTYAQSETNDGDASSVVTDPSISVTAQQRRHNRSKESRRSWTSKHKPYACRHPGCRRSYFFVHDLRRHLRQKHGGMDYNEESGQYEAAATDDGGDHQGALGIDSPQSGHGDSDEQSPDSDDEVSMAAANLVA